MVVGVSGISAAPASTAETWWPSRYGPEDQAGALNEMTPSGVVRAAGLVRTGRVYDLAHVLDEHVPAFPGRTFRQFLTHAPTRRVGSNEVNWIVEFVSARWARLMAIPCRRLFAGRPMPTLELETRASAPASASAAPSA